MAKSKQVKKQVKQAKPERVSSVTKSIENIQRAFNDKNWTYDPKTRGAINTKTGERISRRARDQNYGLLAQQGFKSYETKKEYRKEQGLSGFKMIKGFPNYSERSFDSREKLINFLQKNKQSKQSFRVKLTGQPAIGRAGGARSGKPNAQGDVTIYGEQLAFDDAEHLASEYLNDPDSIEKNMLSVSKWTLTAKKSN